MPLLLKNRRVGEVTIVTCSGRIVEGVEASSLLDHVKSLLPGQRDIVLHLGEVQFVDSSGLGAMVRLLTSSRAARGDLKLCNVTPEVRKTLKLTSLNCIFDIHESESDSISAFYRGTTAGIGQQAAEKKVLCVHPSADVLAYLRQVLRQAGYSPLTSCSLADSLILMKAAKPGLVILDPALLAAANPRAAEAFRSSSAGIPAVELGSDFSTVEAGQAASHLLDRVQAQFAS